MSYLLTNHYPNMYDVDYNNLVNLNAYFKNTVLPTIAIAQGDILNHGISNSYLP